ncbi:BTAD domain-containing putative transcriptional regulator [Deinococcus altitudinis]|uniref:BTAD domain-containing putative transcriptional regulator n=1 Tax=Deinococcus altitudinis TaxID=468914 RepID=UPI0038917C60
MPPLHPIFEAVLNGRFEDGLRLYQQQDAPTPDDDRWAGYCLYALGQPLVAKDLLIRAIGRGCGAAGAELVTVLRSLGDVRAAWAALAALLNQTLSPADRAYALRETAAMHLNDGQPLRALEALEEAWAILGGANEAGEHLKLQTAQLLGYTHHLLGRTAPAMHYLQFSLAGAMGVKRLQPLMTRAQVLLYDGRYEPARQDLTEAAALLALAPGAGAYHAYLNGLLSRAQGRWSDALGAFTEASASARSTGERSTEFLAELGSATVCTAIKEWRAAQQHLQRASRLHQTPWEGALMTLREGYFLGATGQPEAASRLLLARQSFSNLQLARETGWADLHLAEVYAAGTCANGTCAAEGQADHPESRALGAVNRAMLQRSELESVAPLLPELRLLPRLTALLLKSSEDPGASQLLRERRDILGHEPLEIRLRTLGLNQLEVDGQPIRLGLRRALEVVTFLLCRGPARRDIILGTLWPDEDPRKAKNYLYQVVFALKEALPSLQISHDRATGLYRLVCEGPLFSWDVEALKRSLSSDDDNERQRAVLGYTGLFLPEVDAEWAREERDALTFSVTTVGLKLIKRWSAEGEYQKCIDLCWRLLAVDPGDEVLAEYLVEAALELGGLAAAQRVLTEAATRAERELNDRPLWTGRLAQRLHHRVN